MWRPPEAETGRLLCILFVRLGTVPAQAGCATLLQSADPLEPIEAAGLAVGADGQVGGDAAGREPKARRRSRPTPTVPVNALCTGARIRLVIETGAST